MMAALSKRYQTGCFFLSSSAFMESPFRDRHPELSDNIMHLCNGWLHAGFSRVKSFTNGRFTDRSVLVYPDDILYKNYVCCKNVVLKGGCSILPPIGQHHQLHKYTIIKARCKPHCRKSQQSRTSVVTVHTPTNKFISSSEVMCFI